MIIIAGIDPGATGGIAFHYTYDEPGENEWVILPLPRNGDGSLEVKRLHHVLKFTDFVYLESQFSGTGNRIVKEQGAIEAICELLNIKVVTVQSRTWKRAIIPDAGKGKPEQKAAMIAKCLALGIQLPTLKPAGTKLHDGCADAVGIALYGVQQLQKERK